MINSFLIYFGITVAYVLATGAGAGAGYDEAPIAVYRSRVRMALDPEVNDAYPARWIGRVTVTTTDGRTLHGRVDEPRRDPGNTLSRPELEAKALRPAGFGGGASDAAMRSIFERVWRIADTERVGGFLAG